MKRKTRKITTHKNYFLSVCVLKFFYSTKLTYHDVVFWYLQYQNFILLSSHHHRKTLSCNNKIMFSLGNWKTKQLNWKTINLFCWPIMTCVIFIYIFVARRQWCWFRIKLKNIWSEFAFNFLSHPIQMKLFIKIFSTIFHI